MSGNPLEELPPKKLRYEDEILQLLHKVGHLHYSDLMVQLGISYITAISYARALASKYPKNIEYRKGVLTLKIPIPGIGGKK